LTGEINDLFVLDVDAKDDGIEEWSKFLEVHDEPATLKILRGFTITSSTKVMMIK
jgi:hypothetical protein